jgi:hypothetical protein
MGLHRSGSTLLQNSSLAKNMKLPDFPHISKRNLLLLCLLTAISFLFGAATIEFAEAKYSAAIVVLTGLIAAILSYPNPAIGQIKF